MKSIIMLMVLFVASFAHADSFEIEWRSYAKFTQSSGTYTKVSEHTSWIGSWSKTATGVISVTFASTTPNSYEALCVCVPESDAYKCNTVSTSTGTTVKIWAPEVLLGVKNASDSNFQLYCANGFNS